MSVSTVKLLKAAAEISGGNHALAERMGIKHTLLLSFLSDSRELPDALLLRAVDIILSDRQETPVMVRTTGGVQEHLGES